MKIVTHNGKFHSDDVFAVATLLTIYPDSEVIRTRDPEIIRSADMVVDVGDIYDPDNNRFDHHQVGGAGQRENGVPYSSFGLVWKKFGEQICGSAKIMGNIDKSLVQSMDAGDNGVNTFNVIIPGVKPHLINNIIYSYRATWKEEDRWDERFAEAVEWAKTYLNRLIKTEEDFIEGASIVRRSYELANDKRIILVESEQPLGREIVGGILSEFPEPVYAVLLTRDHIHWQVLAVNIDRATLSLRKALPESWRAKHDKDFDVITGVEGGVFCHGSGFMCTTNNKESALKLAEIALNA